MEKESVTGNYKWWVLTLISIQQLVSTGGVLIFGPLAPFLINGLHISRAQVGLFTSAIYLGYMFTAIPWSVLADRIGARVIMLISVLLQGVGYVAMSRTSSFIPAWTAILFAGMAYSAITSVTVKALVYWIPLRLWATAIGIKQTGAVVGGALAAFTLPAIAQATSWETAVFITGAVMAVCGVICYLFYKEHPSERHFQKSRTGVADTSTRNNPVRKDSVVRSIFLNRDIMLLSILMITFSAGQFCFSSYFVLYLNETLLFSVISAGTFFAISQISSGIGRIGWGIVGDRFLPEGRRYVLLIIGISSALMMVLLSIQTVVQYKVVVLLLSAIMGATTLSWLGVELVMVSEMAGKEFSATASGISLTVVCIGNLVGPPLFGYLVDKTGSYGLAWRAVAAAVIVGSLLILLIRETKKVSCYIKDEV